MSKYDPAMGAKAPSVTLDLEDQVVAGRLAYCRAHTPCRAADRDLHALVKPDADPKSPVPRYSSSIDAIVRLISEVLPRWVHGYSYMPGAEEDQAVEVRAWVAGPGYITDDHTEDYFEVEGPTPAAALTLVLVKCLAENGGRP